MAEVALRHVEDDGNDGPVGVLDPAVLAAIPAKDLHRAAYWLKELAQDWRGDVPYRLHEKGVYGLGSAPPFSPEFIGYVGFLECRVPDCRECRKNKHERQYHNPEPRLRATRAFRKVREVAPREFDVLYLYCVQRQTISGIARALTERAIRLDKPERYNNVSVILLLLSGIEKAMSYW